MTLRVWRRAAAAGCRAPAWPNPEHGDREEPKPGFLTKVDDGWFLGSGMYLPAE
jgi:hypothetical protein